MPSSTPLPGHRLGPSLRRSFAIAWGMMPEIVRTALLPFIFRVEERETLEAAEVRARGRVVAASTQDAQARAMLTVVDGEHRCIVLLRSDTADIPEGYAVAIICHELAHCLQYLDAAERDQVARYTETELSAWAQALAWLTFHARREERRYEGIEHALSYALACLDSDVWRMAAERQALPWPPQLLHAPADT